MEINDVPMVINKTITFPDNMNVTQINPEQFMFCTEQQAFIFAIFQIAVVSLLSIITSTLLKPLRMPVMASQMLAALLLSPTFTGSSHKSIISYNDYITLDAYANFGMIFQLFLAGVQTNPLVIVQGGRKAMVIAVSVFLGSLSLGLLGGFFVNSIMEYPRTTSLMVMAAVNPLSALPVVAYYTSELKIQNSEFSRLAIAVSMHIGMWFCFVAAILFLLVWGEPLTSGVCIISFGIIIGIVVYVLRPVIRWIIKMTPEGGKVREEYISFVLVAALVLAWFSNSAGLQILTGPFVFGMFIPPGTPIASSLVETLQFVNSWMIMPVFYTSHARNISIGFDSDNLIIIFGVSTVLLLSSLGKFLGAFIPALYYNMSYNEAILLGLTVNAQGFIEIMMFKFLKNREFIDHHTFEVMYVWMIVLATIFTNLVRYLYKSSMKYELRHNLRTIQHSQSNSELRVLACVYEQQNVPSIIHLLKAINPTKYSPVIVSVIHFVELVGNATPLIISHKTQRNIRSSTVVSQRIINVFKQYEENNRNSISVHPYTVVSPFATLHNDLCTLALQKRTSFMILPFHKQLATGESNGSVRNVNCNLLEKSPCSVGILVDRGLLGGLRFVFANWSSYHVAVVFLGGADDREALALAARMSDHPTIQLTVIHLCSSCNDNEACYINPSENGLDNEALIDFQLRSAYNNEINYIQEEVRSSLEITTLIQSMEDRYELVIVGRRHRRWKFDAHK